MDFYLQDAEPSTNAANILKLIFIIVILAVCLFFGFYPLLWYVSLIYSKFTKKSTRYLGFFNSFSSGIFFGIGLFLLLPESKEVFESWAKTNIEQENLQELPYCFFVCFGAYSFMLLMEKVVFSSQSLIPMISGEAGHGHAHGEDLHEQINHEEGEKLEGEDEDEEAFKNVVSSKGKFASFLGLRNRK